MAKTLNGIVTSIAMKDTIVVEVTRYVPHLLYKKLQKRSKKFKVATNGMTEVVVGDHVKIVETKPMAKGKHFKLEFIQSRIPKTTKRATGSKEKSPVVVAEPVVKEESKKVVKKTKKEAVK